MEVIPSYLGIKNMGSSEGADDLLTNYALRYGEVRSIIYPDSEVSISNKEIEYEVEVQHRDGIGVSTSTIYRGVTVSNLFGGVADKLEMTFRADNKKSKDGFGNGSKVLLLCLSGDQSRAIILGGISSPTQKATKDNGHHLTFEFNGARFLVNNEGEVRFQHRGPTDASGAVLEQYEDYSGGFVSFDKRGNITISQTGGEQYIKLTNRNPDLPDQTQTLEIQGNEKLQARAKQIEITSTGNMFLESEGEAIQMTADRGVFVGAATDNWIKGTTYRLAESACNQTLSSQFQACAAILSTSSVTLTATAGLNAIPLVGGLLALPGFLALAAQLAALGGSMAAMGAAIQTMEGRAPEYLSRNWTD